MTIYAYIYTTALTCICSLNVCLFTINCFKYLNSAVYLIIFDHI